ELPDAWLRTPIAVAPVPSAMLPEPHASALLPVAVAGAVSPSSSQVSPAITGADAMAPTRATACSSRAPLPLPFALANSDATTTPRSTLQILRKMRFIDSSPMDFDGEG